MLSTRNIYIKELSLEEARAVYIGHAHHDFPSDELKPFSMIEKLWNNGCYKGYGFYGMTDGSLHAYAFTMADNSCHMLLLDYFAVCEKDREKGYGSQALALLRENCEAWEGMIFEVEDDGSDCTEEEKQNRRRRIAFYEKNGVRMTGQKSSAFGVDYKLMILPLGNQEAGVQIGEKLSALYRKMLPEKVYQDNFRLR